MSIASEISRLRTAKADLKTSIENKGVTVPSSAKLDDYPDYVDAISQGSTSILQAKTDISPTESSQTITADTGYDGLSSVQINAISSSYVGSGITQRDSTNLTASGATVLVPSGYYASNASKAIPNAVLGNQTNQINYDSVNSNWEYSRYYPNYSAGYMSSIPAIDIEVPAEDKSVTPNETVQTVIPTSLAYYLHSVTVNAIPSTYVGSGVTRRDSADLTISYGAQVNVPNGYYESGASKRISNATKRAENPITTTPTISVNQTGLITASVSSDATITPIYTAGFTDTDTVVYVQASGSATEQLTTKGATTYTPSRSTQTIASGTYLIGTQTINPIPSEYIIPSGSQTLSDNGTYNVTNLAEVVVDVQGGGGGGTQIATKTATPSTASSSIQFTGLSGNPTSFVVTSQADIATNTNGITAVVFDGSSLHGQTMTSQVEADTGFTKSYSNGTLTITATSAQFQANAYKLVYTYGGSASDIETADVQVGSGATSITFSVNGRPAYWSCIFKSDFSTSSGYQRVIAVANDGSSTYGLAMDSSANVQTSWTASYSGGNFTINSQSTNNGGYFHQPGYYQLTYYVDPSAPSYQSKTVTPTASQQIITADAGYDALSQVTVNAIPNTYVQPTSTVGATTYRPGTTAQTIASGTYHSAAATIAAVTQTNLTAANIKSGTTITISNGQSNLWSVTGTYEGDGGSGGTSAHVGTSTITNSSASNTSISFSSLSGTPLAFFVRCTSQLTRSSNSSYYYVTSVRHNGTNTTGNYWRMSNGTFYNDTSHYSYTYSNGTLTVHSSGSRSSAGGSFYNGGYELVYVYES